MTVGGQIFFDRVKQCTNQAKKIQSRHCTASVALSKDRYEVNRPVLKAHISKNEENAMAKAIQEKKRSTFSSLLRKKISKWMKPREKQILPTNTNAKEKRLIKRTLLHYQIL